MLAFLPTMLWSFVFRLSTGTCLSGIESVLVAIYNCSTVDDLGKGSTFTVPSLLGSSSLHTPAPNSKENTSDEVCLLVASLLRLTLSIRAL